MKLSFIIIFVILLVSTNLHGQEEKKKEEPPPPPIPFSEVYKKEIPSQQNVQQRTEEVTNILEIPEYIIRDFIEKRDRLLPYLRNYKDLNIQPFKQQYLSMTNIFYYTPSVPVLISLPFKIKHVIMANPGASSIEGGSSGGQQQGQGQQGGGNVHSIYDDKYLVVFPPPPSTDIWSFVVVSEENEPYYFFGERATTSLSKNKHVIPFMSYVYPPNFDERKLILTYFQQYKKCPYNGETINVNGRLYRFVIKDSSMLASDNYIYFCNRIYEIVKIK